MSDMIRFTCTVCGKKLKAPPELAGRRVKCSCGTSHSVPGDEAEALTERAVDNKHTGAEREREPQRGGGKSRKIFYAVATIGILGVLGAGGRFVYSRLQARADSRTFDELNAIRLMMLGYNDDKGRCPINVEELQTMDRQEEPVFGAALDGVRSGRYVIAWGLNISQLQEENHRPGSTFSLSDIALAWEKSVLNNPSCGCVVMIGRGSARKYTRKGIESIFAEYPNNKYIK